MLTPRGPIGLKQTATVFRTVQKLTTHGLGLKQTASVFRTVQKLTQRGPRG